MTDAELIDAVARLWIAGGGDADGVTCCWFAIKERVAELTEDSTND